MNHTKGPWKLGKEFGLGGKGCQSVFANDETDGRGPTSICNSTPENARLIAAAPEMLEALEHALADLEALGGRTLLVKSAIKKARGEK